MDDPAPSAVACALAEGMRAFDARLTDDQISAIARGIDAQRARGATPARPRKKRLANAVEPITAVTVPDPNG